MRACVTAFEHSFPEVLGLISGERWRGTGEGRTHIYTPRCILGIRTPLFNFIVLFKLKSCAAIVESLRSALTFCIREK